MVSCESVGIENMWMYFLSHQMFNSVPLDNIMGLGQPRGWVGLVSVDLGVVGTLWVCLLISNCIKACIILLILKHSIHNYRACIILLENLKHSDNKNNNQACNSCFLFLDLSFTILL